MGLLLVAAQAGLAGTVAVYAAALAGTLFHYIKVSRQSQSPASARGLVGYLFPAYLVRSRWTRLDILVFVLNKIVTALVFPSGVAMVLLTSSVVRDQVSVFAVPKWLAEHNAIFAVIFLLISLLLRDFVGFYVHLLQHRVPLLWEFHKVHHAPETLVPPTSHRLHPLELLVNLIAESLSLGALMGIFGWATGLSPTELIINATGIYAIVSMITFAPLRHSHIDLRLGWLEYIFLSPAHHQLHHSVERHHWDKNFAALFPLWDWLWNTLYPPPRGGGSYRLGLPGRDSESYSTVIQCYLTPFRKIWRRWLDFGLSPSLRIGPVASWPTPPQTRLSSIELSAESLRSQHSSAAEGVG